MDKEKILSAIQQMDAAIADPTTPEEMRTTLTHAVGQARTQLAEYERDPHGQKRLVDDCHGMLVEMRDFVVSFREMVLSGADPRLGRHIAEYGTIVHSNMERPASEQTFQDDFVVFDYRTRYFNELPDAVSLFNKLINLPNAYQYKPLMMVVARDVDAVLEIVHFARQGAVTRDLLRKATTCSVRAAYFLNPLVTGLTDIHANINDYFPTFLTDAIDIISAELEEEHEERVVEEIIEEMIPPLTVIHEMKAGGRTDDKIEVAIAGDQVTLDLTAYHKLVKDLTQKLPKGAAENSTEAVAFAEEHLEKTLHFAEGETEEAKKRVLHYLALDASKKARGKKGVFAKGGHIGDLKIKVHKKGNSLEVGLRAYRKVQTSIIKKLEKDGLLKEHAASIDKLFKEQIRETFQKHVHFAEDITETEKEKMLEHFKTDTWLKAHGRPGLFKKGGKVTFDDKVKAIAANLKGKPVPKKYQKTEGKRFTQKTATEAARRIVGKAKEKEKTAKVRKMLMGGPVIHNPGNMTLTNLDNLDIHSVGGMNVV